MIANLNIPGISDKLPPHNIDAEEEILGAILYNPSTYAIVSGIIPGPEVFFLEQHQIIYKAIQEAAIWGSTDLIKVMDCLASTNKLHRVGGQNRLVQLVARSVSAINIDIYARLITEKYFRRKLISDCNQAIELAYRGDIRDSIDCVRSSPLISKDSSSIATVTDLNKAEKRIELEALTKAIEVVEGIENPFDREVEIKRLMKRYDIRSQREFFNFHAKWLLSQNEPKSYSLDEYFDLHGKESTEWLLDSWLPKRGISILFSKGGTGKTSLVGSLSKALIEGSQWSGYKVRKPVKILWVQTDQGPTVTTQLLDSQGFFALSSETKVKLRIIDQWNIEQLHVLKKELQQHQYDLVVVDSLSSVSTNSIFSENDQEYARPLVRLRDYSNRFNTSFLILHHSNYNGELRGSTAIFNAADQVFKLERIKSDKPEMEFANLEIQKSRFRQDHRTFRMAFSSEDRSWVSLGEMLPEADVPTPSIGSKQQEIIDFLARHQGVGFQSGEISEHLLIGRDYLRRLLGDLLKDGLISAVRGRRKNKVYFIGKLMTEPPDDEDTKGVNLTVEFKDFSLPPLETEAEPAEETPPFLSSEKEDLAEITSEQTPETQATPIMSTAIAELPTIDLSYLSHLVKSIDVKALSLHQPWAELIARGIKKYETRDWRTPYRGKLIIQAATKSDEILQSRLDDLAKNLGIEIDYEKLSRGMAILIADLTDCIQITEKFRSEQNSSELLCGNWELGRWAWKLENIRLIEFPVPLKGQQSIFPVAKEWLHEINSVLSPNFSVGQRIRTKLTDRNGEITGIIPDGVILYGQPSYLVKFDDDSSTGRVEEKNLLVYQQLSLLDTDETYEAYTDDEGVLRHARNGTDAISEVTESIENPTKTL